MTWYSSWERLVYDNVSHIYNKKPNNQLAYNKNNQVLAIINYETLKN